MKSEWIVAEMAGPFWRLLDLVLIELDQFDVANPRVFAARDKSPVTLGHFVTMIRVWVDSLEKRIWAFYVAGARHTLELAQGPVDVCTVFQDMTGDDEIERVVAKRHVLDDSKDRGAVRDKWLVVSLARDFVGVEQHIRTRKRVASRPDLQDEGLAVDGNMKPPHCPGEVIPPQATKSLHRQGIAGNEAFARLTLKCHRYVSSPLAGSLLWPPPVALGLE